jgi:hypothetical protein
MTEILDFFTVSNHAKIFFCDLVYFWVGVPEVHVSKGVVEQNHWIWQSGVISH